MTTLHSRDELHEALEATWADQPGVPGWFNTVDHKRIGVRYIYTAFGFFLASGVLALIMRVQLAVPANSVVSANAYNGLFTMHGIGMIFLFNTPVLAGFGNYLLPLMLGTRDMAFPRLNAFSYWIYVFSGLFFLASFVIGHPPNAGWFEYPPLVGKAFTPEVNIDFWGLGVAFTGISTTVGAVNFLVSTFKMRAPGMRIDRIPVFVWSMVVFSFMVIFAVPAVTLAASLLELDRLFGTRFYAPTGGGSTLLFQHLFWFWGHPEVYILLIPATGMVSMIIPVFSRRAIAGYAWVVSALVAIGFMSFGVWVHHMFATGIPALALGFFAAASLLITIPSGVQFFAWITTMWKGRVQFDTAMLFCIGFLLVFLLGGITGVMVAMLPFDWQVTDSYFVVAHFHYVLNGAVVFPIFGAIYYWWPKITGRLLSERLGKISFWTMFISFHATFFPMHILGFLGMPRRIYTYQSGLGWDGLNLFVSVSSFVFGIGAVLTVVNALWAKRHGAIAGNNPWHADSLEWATTSPPPDWNFAAIPVVHSRHPLWERDQHYAAEQAGEVASTAGVSGALQKATPFTEGLDPAPEAALRVPEPTYLPFALAAGLMVLVVGLLVNATVVAVVGLLAGAVAMARWAWRTGDTEIEAA